MANATEAYNSRRVEDENTNYITFVCEFFGTSGDTFPVMGEALTGMSGGMHTGHVEPTVISVSEIPHKDKKPTIWKRVVYRGYREWA